jgi:predicted  nucleic acid-binding Zn-ribbon protein
MKKIVSVLVFAVFAVSNLYPQTTETLTNSIILKMVRAKLSDELIIDEINNSRTSFNVSTDSIKLLLGNNVSEAVIRAMQTVTGTKASIISTTDTGSGQNVVAEVADTMKQPILNEPLRSNTENVSHSETIMAKDTLKKPSEEVIKSESLPPAKLITEKIVTGNKDNNPIEESTITADAIGYVIPMEELMKFFDNEFTTLEGTIKAWDSRIRISIEEGNKIKEKIKRLEKELTDKKNADSKGFTSEIITLKSNLAENREIYKQFENSMVSSGLRLIKEIEEFGSGLDRSIGDKFSEISQIVKKTDPDPSLSEIPKSITITKQTINSNVVDYIAPVAEMLFFYQNEIISIREIIGSWNEKVIAVNQKDRDLINKLEPLKKEVVNLQSDPKKNKKNISALKDQISDIEKERKQLVEQMGNDSMELAKYLVQTGKEVQGSVKERITDIIENIKYLYQDSFTYRNI